MAAATTSLPEQSGGERNWDYRYCWLRDSTFTLEALVSCGYADEAAAWRHWLLRAVGGDPDELQVLYTVDGARRIPEQELDWLSGCAGSTPVRVGNSAASQFQLDIFGEVLDTLELARIAGITEHPEREDPTEAVDSAWRVRRLLCESVGRRWEQPDAALLLLGRVGFLPWDDPRIRATVRAVQETLSDDQGFVRRYLDIGDGAEDGVPGTEGSFLACSFWMVDALGGIGEQAEAEKLFSKLLEVTNDVGLIAEEVDQETGCTPVGQYSTGVQPCRPDQCRPPATRVRPQPLLRARPAGSASPPAAGPARPANQRLGRPATAALRSARRQR